MTETSSEKNNANDYDEIPGDLVVEILSKLPVKSLIRFKSVCKPWKLLINSPMFIDIHLHMKNPQILEQRINTTKEDTLESYYKKRDRIGEDVFSPVKTSYIVGVCNGIVCFRTEFPCKRPLLLSNPSTREFSFLPDECDGDFYGFCYDSQTRKYHIISFSFRRDNTRMVNMTLGKMILLKHVKDVTVPGHKDYNVPITSGTSLFWLGFDFDEHGNKNVIVIWYDVIEERFSKMNMPPSSYYLSYKLLNCLKDSVIMFDYPHFKATSFDIWMLIDESSKRKRWMKYQKIGPLEPGVLMVPVDVCCSGKRLLCLKYYSADKQLFYYNLETNQVEDYEAVHPPILDFVNYVESLVPINSLVPCIDTNW